MEEEVLSPQDIKNLKNLSKYLRGFGYDNASVRVELDSTDYTPDDLTDYVKESDFDTTFEYPAQDVEIPSVFQKIFMKMIVAGNEKIRHFSPDTDYVNFQYVNIDIDAVRNETSLIYNCYYYGRGEPEGYTYEGSEDEDVQNILDIVKDACGESPDIRVNYQGSGDSGYLEDYFEDGSNEKVPKDVEDWCYQVLEQFGGWEINEGSDGYFIFNTIDNIVNLTHTYNTEEEETITLFEVEY